MYTRKYQDEMATKKNSERRFNQKTWRTQCTRQDGNFQETSSNYSQNERNYDSFLSFLLH